VAFRGLPGWHLQWHRKTNAGLVYLAQNLRLNMGAEVATAVNTLFAFNNLSQFSNPGVGLINGL